DMGLDPATGLDVTTHRPAVLEAIAQLGHVNGAKWYSSSSDGQRLSLELGAGRLVLDRTNLDSIGFHDATYEAWHKQWWPEIEDAFESQSAEPLTVDPDAS